MLDLPGAYSLTPTTLDEAITRDVMLGRRLARPRPTLIVCVVDATNLRLNLRLVLELKRPRPADGGGAQHERRRARRAAYQVDAAALARELGVPVVETVAVRHARRTASCIERLEARCRMPAASRSPSTGGEPDRRADRAHAARSAPHPAARSATPNRVRHRALRDASTRS